MNIKLTDIISAYQDYVQYKIAPFIIVFSDGSGGLYDNIVGLESGDQVCVNHVEIVWNNAEEMHEVLINMYLFIKKMDKVTILLE